MDEQLTLHELSRLEAERKLQAIPAEVLETAWVREAQIEAVIDAVLVVGLSDQEALAHARHTGEWCARIAGALADGPDTALARRAGVLSEIKPDALEKIPELRHIAACARTARIATIVRVARDFATRIVPDARGHMVSPRTVLRTMITSADEQTLPIVEALQSALRPTNRARVA